MENNNIKNHLKTDWTEAGCSPVTVGKWLNQSRVFTCYCRRKPTLRTTLRLTEPKQGVHPLSMENNNIKNHLKTDWTEAGCSPVIVGKWLNQSRVFTCYCRRKPTLRTTLRLTEPKQAAHLLSSEKASMGGIGTPFWPTADMTRYSLSTAWAEGSSLPGWNRMCNWMRQQLCTC